MIICNDSAELNEMKMKIHEHRRKLRNAVDCISGEIDRLAQFTFSEEKEARKLNPYLVKSVIKNMSRGMSKENAVIVTAMNYEQPIMRVSAVFSEQTRYMAAINLYAKRYTAEKLKKAGYKTKEIAQIIGVSENHIYKLLRAVPDFWFLK